MRGGAWVGAVLMALLVLLVLAGSMLPGSPPDESESVHSFGDQGWAAAYILLGELGFAPGIWRGAPGDLEAAENLLWLSRAPGSPSLGESAGTDPTPERAPTPAISEEGRRARRLLDPAHYDRFAREGGTLVFAADDGGREFLRTSLGRPDLADLPAKSVAREDWGGALLEDGERIDGLGARPWRFEPLPRELQARVLVADAAELERSGETCGLVLSAPHGRGTLVLLASDEFLGNLRLDSSLYRGRWSEARPAGAGLLLVRLVEELRPRGQILFDEYVLGGWQPPSWSELALSPRLVALTLHLLLVVALWIWARAWARDFPRDPEQLEEIAPLYRARAEAGLLVRGRAWGRLAERLAAGVRLRLALRYGVARRGDEVDDEHLRRVLEARAREAGRESELELARRALGEHRVDSAAELARLDRQLLALEHLGRESEGPRAIDGASPPA